MASLESVLAGIPGYGGYLAKRQLNQQEESQGLQQAVGLQGLLTRIQAQEEQKKLSAMMGQFGGDPAKTIQGLLSVGTPQAIELASKLKGMVPDPSVIAEREAKTLKAQMDFRQGLDQMSARSRLAELLNPKSSAYTQTDEPVVTRMIPNEAEAERAAIAHLQSGSKEPYRTVTPNQGDLQSLLLQADPQHAIPQMLKNLNPQPQSPLAKLIAERDKLPPGDPRISIYEEAIKKSSTHQAPVNVYSGGLERGVTPDGKSVFVQGSGRADTPPRVVDPAIASPPPTPSDLRLTQLGANESAQLNRVLMGGNQVAKALGNIVNIPIQSSAGIFGGRVQGKSLFEAAKETLTNTVTTQDVQTYNTLTTGISRALAAIESAGLAPSNSLMHRMDSVTLKEGDTNLTKLIKLAETRQIVEAGYEVVLTNPRVSESQKTQAKEALEAIKKHVPFTPLQVMQLGELQQTNPKATMKDVMQQAKDGGENYPTAVDGKGNKVIYKDGKWQPQN